MGITYIETEKKSRKISPVGISTTRYGGTLPIRSHNFERQLGAKLEKLSQPHCCKKIAMTDPTGTLEKALERNLLNVKHDRPWIPPAAGLDHTFGDVLGSPSNLDKTRIPKRRKCSRRVCPNATIRSTPSKEENSPKF